VPLAQVFALAVIRHYDSANIPGPPIAGCQWTRNKNPGASGRRRRRYQDPTYTYRDLSRRSQNAGRVGGGEIREGAALNLRAHQAPEDYRNLSLPAPTIP
jgi:hypothetical protein